MNAKHQTLLALTSLILAGCVARGESSGSPRANTPVTTLERSFQTAPECVGSFTEHTLAHTTKPRTGTNTVYDSNGSGVAVGDLDNDGLLEVVLGNLDGPLSVLWNSGDFKFKQTTLVNSLGLEERDVRAVQLADVDADGWLDVTLSHTRGGISFYRNDQRGGFAAQTLPGVSVPAYTMLWDDLRGDGRLALVTGSYDAMLEAEGKDFLFTNGAGVVVYERVNNAFRPNRLSRNAQALAVTMFDVNADRRRDLLIGNDFAVPDFVWLNTPDGWIKTEPFKRITKNTMGLTVADVFNSGQFELYATDMKPDFNDPKAVAAWMPFMEKTFQKLQYASTQRAENVLQRRSGNGFQNIAYELGLDATGWSWSAQFGDLNNDGHQDLYVVNGMIDQENLKYLPNHELIERNKVFNNTGNTFEPRADWKLDSTASGRGMVMADLNNDGRLDIVVNNLRSPTQLFENRLCGGSSLEVELRWPQSGNTHALGATVELRSSAGVMQRQVVSQSGYLSGPPPRVHFGLPDGAKPESLQVIWSDGTQSSLQKPKLGAITTITRANGGQK